MAAILNFRIFAKNGKTQICFYQHEAEIIYIYTNKYLSIIDIFYKWNRVL